MAMNIVAPPAIPPRGAWAAPLPGPRPRRIKQRYRHIVRFCCSVALATGLVSILRSLIPAFSHVPTSLLSSILLPPQVAAAFAGLGLALFLHVQRPLQPTAQKWVGFIGAAVVWGCCLDAWALMSGQVFFFQRPLPSGYLV